MADRKRERFLLAGLDRELHLQRPASPAAAALEQPVRAHRAAVAEKRRALRAGLRALVERGHVADARGRAGGQADLALGPRAHELRVARVDAHQPVDKQRDRVLGGLAAAVLERAQKAQRRLVRVRERRRRELQSLRAALEARLFEPVRRAERRDRPVARQKPEVRAALLVREVEHEAPALDERVVAERRQPALAAVVAEQEAAAALGDQRAEAVAREHVRPRGGRGLRRVDRVALVREPAVAVEELALDRLQLEPARLQGPVRRAPAEFQRAENCPQLRPEARARAAVDEHRRDALHLRALLGGNLLAVEHVHAAGNPHLLAQVRARDHVLQGVAHRLLVVVSVVVDQDEVEAQPDRPVELVRAHRVARGGELRALADRHREYREIAGDAERPEVLPPNVDAGARSLCPCGEPGVDQKRARAGEQVVRLGVQSDEAEHRARLRIGELPRALGGGVGGVAVYPSLDLARLHEPDREVHLPLLARLQLHLRADRRAGVQGVSERSAEAALHLARAADELSVIGLPTLDARAEQHRRERVRAPARAAGPAREQEHVLAGALGGDEEVLERRVRVAVRLIAQRDRERLRQLQRAVRVRSIPEAHALYQGAVLGRHRRGQLDVDVVHRGRELREARVEPHRRVLRDGHEPAARRVAHIDGDARPVLDQVSEEPVREHAVAAQKRLPARRQNRARARAGEYVLVDEPVFDASEAERALLGPARGVREQLLLPAPKPDARGRLFLQQQRQRARLGNPLEQVRDRVRRQSVCERGEHHALVVRHVALDELRVLAAARGRVVRRLVEPALARPTELAHPKHVVGDLSGHRREREHRGVRRDDALAHAAAQREFAQPERAVLVVQMEVERVVAGLADAPRPPAQRPEPRLHLRDRAVALGEQRAVARAHEDLRHQVFEHRAAPRDERLPVLEPDRRPCQFFPMRNRNLAEHHRDVAQNPRLRREQVVVRCAQPPVFDVRADHEQLSGRVVQREKVHARGERAQPVRQFPVERFDRRRERHQARGEVSAVDRGHVARLQRAEAVDVVPVVEVAVPLVELFDAVHRVAHAREHLSVPEKPERARREAREQVEPDVRRRGSARAPDRGVDLHVVRRQPVLALGHVLLKEAPGVPRELAERADLPHGQRAARVGRGRLHVCDQSGRQQEKRRERQRRGHPRGRKQPGDAQYRPDAAGRADARAARRGVRGGHPLEHVLLRKREPKDRAQHRVHQRARGRRERREAHDRSPP
ncbi:MAG: hypothetical protein BWY81_01637 [Firmicutes bacterium ADurb.Bin467]|nr:MAG: hypothetical protein BWY81_01637 [Firmicutes bacterium ADurb.Bin467]